MKAAMLLNLSLLTASLTVLLVVFTVEPTQPDPVVVYETIVREVQPEPELTPILDSMVPDEEWEEIDRQSECLFVFLQDHFGHDITLDRVLAAGYWTDQLGGACAVIGEDG